MCRDVDSEKQGLHVNGDYLLLSHVSRPCKFLGRRNFFTSGRHDVLYFWVNGEHFTRAVADPHTERLLNRVLSLTIQWPCPILWFYVRFLVQSEYGRVVHSYWTKKWRCLGTGTVLLCDSWDLHGGRRELTLEGHSHMYTVACMYPHFANRNK